MTKVEKERRKLRLMISEQIDEAKSSLETNQPVIAYKQLLNLERIIAGYFKTMHTE